MIKFAPIILLLFISCVIAGGLEGKNEHEQKYIDATYGQTPISESNSRPPELKAVKKRLEPNIQSDSDTFFKEDRSFFTTSEKVDEKAPKEKAGSMSSKSSDSFDSRSDDFFSSSSKSSPSSRSSSSSSSSSSDSFSVTDDSTSNGSTGTSGTSGSSGSSSSFDRNRQSSNRFDMAATVKRMNFQRPWCPGQALASIIPIAAEPVYRWLETTETCEEFAKRFGNLYISVQNFEDSSLNCEYIPAGGSMPNSEYTAIRSVALNQPVYASLYDKNRNITFAIASGLIFKRDGIVLAINIAKPVNQLPQICRT